MQVSTNRTLYTCIYLCVCIYIYIYEPGPKKTCSLVTYLNQQYIVRVKIVPKIIRILSKDHVP